MPSDLHANAHHPAWTGAANIRDALHNRLAFLDQLFCAFQGFQPLDVFQTISLETFATAPVFGVVHWNVEIAPLKFF